MKKLLLLASSALIAPIAVMVPVPAMAQQITTSIQGRVTSETGSPLGNARVTITDTRTGTSQEFTANSDGSFSAQNLTTGGPYTVTAIADGHQGQTLEQVFTTLQGATELTFSLSPITAEVAGDTIVVTGTRVRVTQLEVGPGTSFSTQVMQNAPSFNRDVRDIIRLDPRVSLDREDAATGGSGQDRISCLGGNDRANTFTVDGLAQSDLYGLNDTGFSSRSSTPIPYDAVRETQVQFAPFDTEYGNFSGCAINVVTKSGTNKFHGSAFYEFSNNDLRGDSVAGDPVAPVKADKRWGVSLGGPIIKDRLFFFGAYEKQTAGNSQDDGPAGGGFANEIPSVTVDQFNEISQVLRDVYGIDTGPLVTNRPFSNKRLFGRVDWQITDDHRLEVTYQRLKESTMRSDDFFTGSSPQVTGANTFLISGTDSKYYSARLYSTWSDRFSTEFRYSRAKIQDLQDPVGGGEAQSGNPIPRIIVGVDNPPLGSSPIGQDPPDATILAGPGNSRSANDLRTRVDMFKAVANYDGGDHKLKLGFEVNTADIFNLFVQNATGTLVFRNLADLQAGLLSPGTGNNQTSTLPFRVTSGQTEGAFGNFSRTGDVNDAAAQFTRTIYSAYLQDDWRVNDRLNAVIGVRTDIYDGGQPSLNPNFVERYGFANTTGFSDIDPVILPRLGLTYEMDDFSVFTRSKIQGGVGIFSGGDPLVWFGNAFQNNGFGFGQGTTQAAGCPAGQIDVVTGGQFTGIPECFRQAGINQAAAGLGDTQSIDPDIKMPTVWRANIGWQTDMNFGTGPFASGWRLNLDYIYSRYKNPFTIVDLSQTPNINEGLNGFTIDGRPIYAAIDPTRAGCDAELVDINPTPVWQGVSGACFGTSRDDELMLTNSGSYDSHIASLILSKNFDRGILTQGGSSYFTFGYAFTAASDRRNMFNSTAGSNYDQTAAFDRQNPAESPSFYGSRHNITFSGNIREEFFDDLATSFGFSFVARSGRPYSLTFSGDEVFNDAASGSNNALLYVPSGIDDPNISPDSDMDAVQQLTDFASRLDCAKKYLGRSIKRNSCSNDWYFDLDLRLSQELPGPGRLFGSPYGMRDKITLFAMFDNFLNFLDNDWNVQRRRNFAGLQDVADIEGIDDEGRYIISGVGQLETGSDGLTGYQRDNFVNVSSSVWRVKVGVSYEF
ncbi:MAG TPA: carboxypeptidase regulatory-like domain-containing protein [Sphingomicrobium sp.]|nr:carboxypeptidase regulatory-like domain-containing protein [Sphingomicrobium sp.]